MPRRVVIDPSGSPRQVLPPSTSANAPRRRRRAEPADDVEYPPARRQVPQREVPVDRTPVRREVPRREVPRRDVTPSGGTPAQELVRRAAAGREALARQIASRRDAERGTTAGREVPRPETREAPRQDPPQRQIGRRGAPDGTDRPDTSQTTGSHRQIGRRAAPDDTSHQTGGHRQIGRRSDTEDTGGHRRIGRRDDTGSHRRTEPAEPPAADSTTSRRTTTWRDGPREDATWRDTTRREVPRRQARRAEPPAPDTVVIEPTAAGPAAQPSEAAPPATLRAVPDLDAASHESRRAGARRAAAGAGTTAAGLISTGLTRAARRRGMTRPESTHGDASHSDSGHREARNRRATSRELPHARDTGPRRHRRLGRKRIGIGLLAMLTIAVGVTTAAGFALSRPEQTTPIASTAATATPCNQTGPGQREVEAYIATRSGQYGRVKLDGRQSPSDCAAIASFQRWAQVPSRTGFADATTGFLARQLGAIRYDQCQAPGDRTTVCVDLTNQAMWVVRSGRIILGPTVARSGRQGQATPTGTYQITQKKVSTISSEFGTPLPYWERFVDDIGFHTADTPMYAPIPGSFGCVNLLDRDAKALYQLTEIGTSVSVFGRKPGT
jgi:hypothetical protein